MQASVTGLAITVGLMSSDYGQFKVQADMASFQLGSYVTLTADGAVVQLGSRDPMTLQTSTA